MTLLFARGGSDLREVHSRSIHGIDALRPVEPGTSITKPLGTLVPGIVRRFKDVRRARAMQRELESLSDAVLTDLGITRTAILKHISEMRRRQRAARTQTIRGLSDHLLKDLAIPVREGDAKVYTTVPLGVVSVYSTPKMPANTENYRKTA
jgi:uncharacterized protein YjiS (DUF1127 family)